MRRRTFNRDFACGVALDQRGEVLAREKEELVAEECTLVGRSACAFKKARCGGTALLQRPGLHQSSAHKGGLPRVAEISLGGRKRSEAPENFTTHGSLSDELILVEIRDT